MELSISVCFGDTSYIKSEKVAIKIIAITNAPIVHIFLRNLDCSCIFIRKISRTNNQNAKKTGKYLLNRYGKMFVKKVTITNNGIMNEK